MPLGPRFAGEVTVGAGRGSNRSERRAVGTSASLGGEERARLRKDAFDPEEIDPFTISAAEIAEAHALGEARRGAEQIANSASKV